MQWDLKLWGLKMTDQKVFLQNIFSPLKIGFTIYPFFVPPNGFDIFPCLIPAPHKGEKFRTTILGPSWRQIKVAGSEYSTAFPSAAATHFAAMSPERLIHAQSNTSEEESWREKKKLVVASVVTVGCEDEVSVSRLQLGLPGVLGPWMVYDRPESPRRCGRQVDSRGQAWPSESRRRVERERGERTPAGAARSLPHLPKPSPYPDPHLPKPSPAPSPSVSLPSHPIFDAAAALQSGF